MNIEIVSIAFASLSAACSASIVLTGLVFPSMMLSPMHPFSNMLFMIALCDMICSVGFSLGYPLDGSTLCTTQAFLRWFFTPASWLWSLALVYQMHCIVVHKKLHLSINHLHMIIWTLCCLIAFLPLIQVRYGQNDDYNGDSVCLSRCTTSRTINCYIWIASLDESALIISIIMMTAYLYKISRYLHNAKEDSAGRERVLFQSLCWYPIGLIVCWTFVQINFWILCFEGHRTALQIQVAYIIASQYGTICCITFFSSSSLVRQRWIDLLTCDGGHHIESTSEADQSVASRESFLSDVKDIEIMAYYERESVVLANRMSNNDTADLRDRNISRESEMAVYRVYDITTNALNNEIPEFVGNTR
jgi:hypothetical protein